MLLLPTVALTGGKACSCLGHGVCNELGEWLSGVSNTQANDLCIWVSLLVGTTAPGNLLTSRHMTDTWQRLSLNTLGQGND